MAPSTLAATVLLLSATAQPFASLQSAELVQGAPPATAGQAPKPAQAQPSQSPPAQSQPDLPLVTVDHDDVVIRESCRLAFGPKPIVDANGNGVVRIEGSGITVDLGGAKLQGTDARAPADGFTGTGIVVLGSNVTLQNGGVRGYRCGVLATGADKSTFQKLDLSGNFATHLLSTTAAENSADWLWPHENDGREWVTRYGASLCIERSSGVTVRDVVVRGSQNGIILDRVSDSRIYDNDCSFLSGWGLAMWRSSNNVVCRNAFDFCVRGYSHGVYNRGQDSAGILVFEQCSKNTIALNSVTHGGDGLFGFAGKEALGERPSENYGSRRGCNDNIIVGNDFSFAAAHGLEMTFSFGNVIAHNAFEQNGICGIWGGYSQGTTITENRFAGNGGGTGHGEGGAIDIEHGKGNLVVANSFRKEGVAVEFWWDDDKALLSGPWAKANGAECSHNVIVGNTFEECGTALGLLQATDTIVGKNSSSAGEVKVTHDEASTIAAPSGAVALPTIPTVAELESRLPGINTPIGKHRELGGREAIRMTPWGPWDGKSAILSLNRRDPGQMSWQLYGAKDFRGGEVAGGGSLRVDINVATKAVVVNMEMPGNVSPFLLRVRFDGKTLFAEGCVYRGDWHVAFFPSAVDPRTDLATWREGATSEESVTVDVPTVDFEFGNDGPLALKLPGVAGDTLKAITGSKLGADHFGTIAKSTLTFPKGTFTLRTISDDGVRVIVDGKTVIEDWTWHTPRESSATLTFEEPKEVEIVVEHFELDGFATLRLFIDGEIEASRKAGFGLR